MAKATKEMTKRQRLIFVSSVAAVIIALVSFVAYDLWMVSHKTQAVLKAPGVISQEDTESDEGSDTTVRTKGDLASYQVAPDAPRILRIEKLGVTARVQPMGLNSNKSIQAPTNINDAGWYTGSAKPGDTGALFIDGHASGSTRQGLFAYLDTLKPGDAVQLEKGDGTVLRYRVVHTATISLKDIDMRNILTPYPGVKKGLNLMTCTGTWIKDARTLDHRVVVYTEQV